MILIILLLSTALLFHRASVRTAAQTAARPDAYMNNVNAIILDKDGQPKLKIISEKMVHFTEGNQAQFEQPTVVLYQAANEPWFIQSKYAQTIRGIDEILFWNNVTALHRADDKGPEAIIKTPELTVDTQLRTARTNAIITLVQPNLIVQSTGMIANLQNSHVQLLSKTKAFYVPDEAE